MSESDSSSEGETSPYFQRRQPFPTPEIQMAKRKDETESDDTSKMHRGPPTTIEKCLKCAQSRSRCDGISPFTEKCAACVKRKTKCVPQDTIIPETLPKDQRCQKCFKDSRRCDGIPPFTTKCTSCNKKGGVCVPQHNSQSTYHQKQRDEDKCNRCATNGYKCDGNDPCSSCVRRKWPCSYERKPSYRPRSERCDYCKGADRRCDGEKPCNVCKKMNKQCQWTDENTTWIYRTNPETWPKPTPPGHCLQCQTNYTKYFGGAPYQCDGEFPCMCCTDNSFGQRQCCTHNLGNGITKRYKLTDEKAEGYRRSGNDDPQQKQKDFAKNQRKKERRQKNLTSDSKEPQDDDLIDTHEKDDDSDAGGESNDNHPNQHHDTDSDEDQRGDSENRNGHHDHDHDEEETTSFSTSDRQ